jgi:hypothetical protein
MKYPERIQLVDDDGVVIEPANKSNQDALNGKIDTLNAKDFANQTTLVAVLAKIIAAPATEAKQDTLNAKDFATSAKQDALSNKVGEVQATPTSNTILGRLKDVWDRLLTIFTIFSDVLDHYKEADEDYSTAGTVYRGFTDKDGNWFIVKEVITSTAKTVRFCKGTTGYETATTGAWATRASQTYDYFHVIF